MITAILCTGREEPQFGWMADSLSRCLTYYQGPFELIVVDMLLWRDSIKLERRSSLADAVKGRFSYRHVTPKPTPWQGPYRKTSRDYYALCNARNTGIALARGSHVVLFDDCTVLDEQWLKWHGDAANKGLGVAGSFKSYLTATIVDGCVVSGELHPSQEHRGPIISKAYGGWMWGLNTSFPLEWALKVNGYDEKYDGQGGSEDCCLGVRLERAGCTLVYIPECIINQILETHSPVCDFETWGKPQERKQKERLLLDGKMHFANELLIQELGLNPARTQPLGNEFSLRGLRDHALRTGDFPTHNSLEVDWRDDERLENM